MSGGYATFARLFIGLSLLACAVPGHAGIVRAFPSQGERLAVLRIHGSIDADAFARVIRDYQRLRPGTDIVYEDSGAQEIYADAVQPPPHAPRADLLISSGMDLQTKLANDRHVRAQETSRTASLPAWAHWRHEVLGIGYDPVVLVYNTRKLEPARVPRNRRQLLDMMRAPGTPLRGRVGTYDAERSSVGYLFATQDSQLGTMAGTLLGALGENDVQLEARAGVLLDRVARGELLMAYNVIGSYAQARIDAGAPLGIVQLEDYTLLMLRTALIPRTSPHPHEAGVFLDYLLSPRGQRLLERQLRLRPVLPSTGQRPGSQSHGALRPIPLGPGLLVHLDALKRRQYLAAWRASMRRR